MEDGFFAKNVVSQLLQCMQKTIERLVIGIVIKLGIYKSFRMVGHMMTSMFKYDPNGELRWLKT